MANIPITYLGGDLRYTIKTDYKLKCISMVLKYTNDLALEFGRIMESDPSARRRITNDGN
jgi:hypothetical protein